jgi:hypothetical protein
MYRVGSQTNTKLKSSSAGKIDNQTFNYARFMYVEPDLTAGKQRATTACHFAPQP